MSVRLSERAEFFNESMPLEPEAVRQRFEDWLADRQIFSRVVPVGRIAVRSDTLSMLMPQPLDVLGPQSQWIEEDSVDGLWRAPAVAAPRSDFLTIVEYDKQRAGITASGIIEARAGDVRATKLPWHPDRPPFIRWVVSLSGEGIEGTRGAEGHVRFSDDEHNRLNMLFNSGQLKEMRAFPSGTVLRFMTGDVHRAPRGPGKRLFIRETLGQALLEQSGWLLAA